MAFTGYFLGYAACSWAVTLVSLIGLYSVIQWVYNVFFHPLAKFPGPLSWRASRLPYMRATWSGHFPYYIDELHKQYGDVVRTAPNELSFRNPAAWNDIYTNNNGSQAFSKSEIWHGNPDGGPASVFVTPGMKEHARVRQFMDPAFSEKALLQQEPILHKYVNTCVEKLRERASAAGGKITVNVVDWLNFTLFDIIGDLAFGESFGCLQTCRYEDWMADMGAAIKLHFLSINLRYYPIIITLLTPLQKFLIPEKIIKQYMDYRQRSAAKLDRRLKSHVDRPDIVSQLLRSKKHGDGLTQDEVEVNCMLFINAASETTATTLTGLFNNLVQNPKSLSQLESEINQFSSASDMTLDTLKELPYLNAALKEALRMCGPTPVGNMRITPPEGGVVDGHYVAGNTMVTIPQVAVAFCEQHFYQPHAWRPERWLSEAETDMKSPYYNDRRDAVRAFGVGPYNCVGEPLAWAQMRLLVAKIIWSFQIAQADTANAKIDWDKQEVYAVYFKHPLDITFTPKKREA